MMPVTEAAKELGERPGTVRRWVREGCPCTSPGRRGRGHALTVDIEAVRQWREARERKDSGRAALIVELRAAIPGIVADAALQALGEASPQTQGGAELRRLRAATSAMARNTSDALLHYLWNKLHGGD